MKKDNDNNDSLKNDKGEEPSSGSNRSKQDPLEKSPEELFKELETSVDGLTQSEAEKRFAKYGPNAIEEKKDNMLLKFLSYFWGPIAWMIEVAAVLSVVVNHWTDFIIIAVLLFFNAIVGFWQEHQAANAVEALKKQLAVKARVKRDGSWTEVDATTLVPGDILRIRLGDIIPADVKLLDGDYLSVDQSALTGESLPVSKKQGDAAYSGSVAKQGEMVALTVGTGANTFFGRTAKLVSTANTPSHFQKAVLTIGDYLIYLSLGLAVILFFTMLLRGAEVLTLVQFALILVVAAIPVAMPAVLSVTMAVGSVVLSKMKAIVTRLQSIEEMAGMDIICSDKTGTLTENKLTLGEPALFGAGDSSELILAGALASKTENRDAIDMAVLNGVKDSSSMTGYKQVKFTPFDPVNKRTEAEIQGPKGKSFKVTKGAPQVILKLCQPAGDLTGQINDKVNEFAGEGYRTLGVARTDGGSRWQFLGLLPLFDPPREDSAETIREANKHGIKVKMVTGDNTAIAKEISKKLGLGTSIHTADEFFKDTSGDDVLLPKVTSAVEAADGFAQVFPEHKYQIVKALQSRGHIIGMTGDGVNDAPALKQADTGIAVSGATDAARAAAAVVLTAPGLSVIIKAVETARTIFERMNSYAIYRITETIRIMFFVVLAMIAYNFYPITAIMIILLAFANDLPIMAIAYDNTWLDPKPVKWDMHRVLSVSTVLGLLGVVETFGMLVLGEVWLKLSMVEIQTLIFLKLAIAGHLTLFVARTRKSFLTKPYPSALVLWSAIGTKLLVTAFVAFGFGLVAPISWGDIGFVWAYCLVWVFIEDWAKLHVYHRLEFSAKRHRKFVDQVQKPLHVHAR